MSTVAKEYESPYSATRFHAYSGKVKRYMNLARQVAQQSTLPDYRHGAVLVRGSVRNISTNKNGYCSFGSRFQHEHNGISTLHAELGAILGVDRSITEGATVYIARIGKKGKYKISKPCSMCHAAMRHVGIRKVVYTIDNKMAGSYRL